MSYALPSQLRQDQELKFQPEASIFAIVIYFYFEVPLMPKLVSLGVRYHRSSAVSTIWQSRHSCQ